MVVADGSAVGDVSAALYAGVGQYGPAGKRTPLALRQLPAIAVVHQTLREELYLPTIGRVQVLEGGVGSQRTGTRSHLQTGARVDAIEERQLQTLGGTKLPRDGVGIRAARNGQLNTSDGRVITGVLQANAAVAQGLYEDLVVEDEGDAAAQHNELAGQVDERWWSVGTQPNRQVTDEIDVARRLQQDVAQLVDGILALTVDASEGDGLHIVFQIQTAGKLLHELHGFLAGDSSCPHVGLVVGIQDLIEPTQRVGVDAVFAAGEDV